MPAVFLKKEYLFNVVAITKGFIQNAVPEF